jgi:hypothetical protein
VERATTALQITLTSVPTDDERDLLKDIYVLEVACEAERKRQPQLGEAARRLRALVSLPPTGLPEELWKEHVENATPAKGTIELQIDSEPTNAQIQIDFHGEGNTPRTLKVAPGLHYIELQKDGYRKAFRAVTVLAQPVRTVLRLVDRSHDRVDQAQAVLQVLRKAEHGSRAAPLARLAQLARTELLVVVSVADGQVTLWLFDAERGAMAKNAIESPYDADTGRVTALAELPTPSTPRPSRTAAGILAPMGEPAAGSAGPRTGTRHDAVAQDALPEAPDKATERPARRSKPAAPWWGWAIAGALCIGLGVFVYMDQPTRQDTLAVKARWLPPSSGM